MQGAMGRAHVPRVTRRGRAITVYLRMDVAPDDLRFIVITQQRQCARVDKRASPLQVDAKDAIGRGVENAGDALIALAQRPLGHHLGPLVLHDQGVVTLLVHPNARQVHRHIHATRGLVKRIDALRATCSSADEQSIELRGLQHQPQRANGLAHPMVMVVTGQAAVRGIDIVNPPMLINQQKTILRFANGMHGHARLHVPAARDPQHAEARQQP